MTRKTEIEAGLRHSRLLSVFRALLVYSQWTPSGIARDFWELLKKCQGTCFIRKKQPRGLWLPAVCNEAIPYQRIALSFEQAETSILSACAGKGTFKGQPSVKFPEKCFLQMMCKSLLETLLLRGVFVCQQWGGVTQHVPSTHQSSYPSSQGMRMHLCRPLTAGASTLPIEGNCDKGGARRVCASLVQKWRLATCPSQRLNKCRRKVPSLMQKGQCGGSRWGAKSEQHTEEVILPVSWALVGPELENCVQ